MKSNGQYRWYWSRWEEMERCHGAKSTRDEIIADGRANFTADEFEEDETPGFWIVEADRTLVRPVKLSPEELEDVDFDLTAQWAIELVLEANEEAYGEDGYEGPAAGYDPDAEAAFDEELRAIDRTAPDVADRVNAAIERFVAGNQTFFAPFVFGDTRNIEFVPLHPAEVA